MAIFVSNWRVLIWSIGMLSAAVLLRLSVPLILEFAIHGVPILYGSVASWLRPPYLYILINCIIISILATSKLQRSSDEEGEGESPPPPAEVSTALNDAVPSDFGYLASDPKLDYVFSPERVHGPPLAEARALDSPERKSSPEAMDGGDFSSKKERDFEFFSDYSDKENEKPPVSARFAHRKALKSSPEGNGLRRVLKPKRQDTLESTWRTITEGRAMPLTRHLKKSETIDPHARRASGQDDPTPGPVMKKSETFSERSKTASPRREASLSQDELNRRVEAFINKFNEEMRLQRQESLNQYREMVGFGAN